MTGNRTFWKTLKPFLADKTSKTSRITKIEEERIFSPDHQIAKNMPKNQVSENFDSSEEELVSSIIKKYRNNPSIKLIKTKNKSKTFRFKKTNIDEIKKFIEKFYPKKAFQNFDRSTNFLKKMQLFLRRTSGTM